MLAHHIQGEVKPKVLNTKRKCLPSKRRFFAFKGRFFSVQTAIFSVSSLTTFSTNLKRLAKTHMTSSEFWIVIFFAKHICAVGQNLATKLPLGCCRYMLSFHLPIVLDLKPSTLLMTPRYVTAFQGSTRRAYAKWLFATSTGRWIHWKPLGQGMKPRPGWWPHVEPQGFGLNSMNSWSSKAL